MSDDEKINKQKLDKQKLAEMDRQLEEKDRQIQKLREETAQLRAEKEQAFEVIKSLKERLKKFEKNTDDISQEKDIFSTTQNFLPSGVSNEPPAKKQKIAEDKQKEPSSSFSTESSSPRKKPKTE